MFKKTLIAASLAMVTTTAFAAAVPPASAEKAVDKATQVVVFQNVNIFNGTEDKLYKNHSVVVSGNKITAIHSES